MTFRGGSPMLYSEDRRVPYQRSCAGYSNGYQVRNNVLFVTILHRAFQVQGFSPDFLFIEPHRKTLGLMLNW